MVSPLQLDDKSTPLRKNNYDLLCKMVTEVAVENTVKEMSNRRSEEVAGKWLQVDTPLGSQKHTLLQCCTVAAEAVTLTRRLVRRSA